MFFYNETENNNIYKVIVFNKYTDVIDYSYYYRNLNQTDVERYINNYLNSN
jgi:hypothetical protein